MIENFERYQNKEDTTFDAIDELEESLLVEEQAIDRDRLKKIRKALTTAMIFMSSFLQMGCQGESELRPETERERIERQFEERHESGSYELLGKILERISRGFDASSSEDSWVFRNNEGRFFEIKLGDDYDKLADFVRFNYRETTNPTVREGRMRTITARVEEELKKIGREIHPRDIPEELRNKLEEKRGAVDQMQRGDIIQPY